jgi:hypothetical protein
MRGVPFTREQLLSGAVVVGDNPPPRTGLFTGAHDKELCDLLLCLLRPEAFGKALTAQHVNIAGVRSCIESWCKALLAPPSQEELSEREGTSTAANRIAGGPPLVAGGAIKKRSTVVETKKSAGKPSKPSRT